MDADTARRSIPPSQSPKVFLLVPRIDRLLRRGSVDTPGYLSCIDLMPTKHLGLISNALASSVASLSAHHLIRGKVDRTATPDTLRWSRGIRERQMMARRTASSSGFASAGCPMRDPTISELLSDPLIRAIMEADGVDPMELKAMMCRLAACCRNRPRAAPELARASAGSRVRGVRARRTRR